MKKNGAIKKVCGIIRMIIMMSAGVLVLGIGALAALDIRPYAIVSGSMEPEITTGSLCFIDHNKRSAEVGDIIAYEAGDMTVTHRVVDKTPQGYITKGDKNTAVDPCIVSQGQITGRALFHIPYIGYVTAVLGGVGGMMTAVLIFTIPVLMRSFIKCCRQ